MNRLQNDEEMGFFDYLFLGALLNKFKNTLKNHNDSTYSSHSYTYNNSDDYDYDTDLEDPLLDDLGQDMFVKYEDPFRSDPLYDEDYPYYDDYIEDFSDDDLYDEDEDDDLYDDDINYRY